MQATAATTPLVERLAGYDEWSYTRGGPGAVEPAALSCLALQTHGRREAADRAACWLAGLQAKGGSLGVTQQERSPCWPTALAILAWTTLDRSAKTPKFEVNARRAIAWALKISGNTSPRKSHIGHDTTIAGWPWVAGTHSWLEPTALFVLALRAAGYEDHPRTREAQRMIVDRLLPEGGCNYGNTLVLGQALLPHVQPTGLAMLALGGVATEDPRVERSLQYLQRSLSEQTPTASLCWGLLGLAAHNRIPPVHPSWLAAAQQRTDRRGGGAYDESLLALAARAADSPLVRSGAYPVAGAQ